MQQISLRAIHLYFSYLLINEPRALNPERQLNIKLYFSDQFIQIHTALNKIFST